MCLSQITIIMNPNKRSSEGIYGPAVCIKYQINICDMGFEKGWARLH